MAHLIEAVPDGRFDAPTPCPDLPLGALVDHIGTLSRVFTGVARKEGGSLPPPPSADNLEPGWRIRIAADLETLVAAWQEPAAWEGTTGVAGLELPGDVAGLVVLDELVVHGWDLAVALGETYGASEEEVEAVAGFVTSFPAPRNGSLFGPVVEVADDAPALDRLLGLTGRDPAWSPAP